MVAILLARLISPSIFLTVLTGFIFLFIKLFRISHARLRSILWLLVLAKPVCALILGSALILPIQIWKSPPPEIAQPVHSVQHVHFVHTKNTTDPTPPTNVSAIASKPVVLEPSPPQGFDYYRNFILSIWLAGALVMMIRIISGHYNLSKIIRRSERPMTPRLQGIFKDICREMKIKRTIAFMVSREISSPVFAGIFSPVILIPKELDSEDHACDLRWILRHELTHYKMLDHIAQLVRQMAQVLFFFHPCVWIASHKWEEAAEYACDCAVIRNKDDVEFYSRALSRIVESIQAEKKFGFVSGLFMAKTRIGKRIAALLDPKYPLQARLSAFQIMIIGILSAALLFTSFHFASAESAMPPLKSQMTPPYLPQTPIISAPAPTLNPIAPKSVDVYMNDFSDANSKYPAGWEIFGASDEQFWFLANGTFNTGNGDDMRTKDGWSYAIYKGNSPIGVDYAVSVNFKMLQGNGAVAVIMGWKDADNHYRGFLRSSQGRCSMIIEKVENGIAQTISQKTLDLKEIPHGEKSQFEKLSMQIVGNSVFLTFQNNTIKANDNNIQEGYAGLGEWYNSIIFDDFVLAVNTNLESLPVKEDNPQTSHWNHFILLTQGMSLSKATELREQYAAILGDVKIIIKADEQNGFNLLIGPFSNENDVWAACQNLKQKNIPYVDIIKDNVVSEDKNTADVFDSDYKPDNEYAGFNVLINEFPSDKRAHQVKSLLQNDGYYPLNVKFEDGKYQVLMGPFSDSNIAPEIQNFLDKDGYPGATIKPASVSLKGEKY